MSKKKVSDREYLSLSAMIRAREAVSPNRDKLERVLDAQSFSESVRMLTECRYPDMSNLDANGINAALNAYRKSCLDELENAVPEPCIVEAFRIKYDCANAKVMVKASAANVDGEHLISDCGCVPPDALMEAFNSGEMTDLPAYLAEAMEQARGILGRTGNPQLSDVSLDNAYFARLLELGEAESSGFLLKYAKTLIDSANLRILVRARRMGKDLSFFQSVSIPGGNVDSERLVQAYESGEIVRAFGDTAFLAAAQEAEQLSPGEPLTRFELKCDNAVTDMLTEAKRISFGAGPVIAYLAAQEQEISSIRMILTGKLSGVATEKIRERLRDSYA